MLTVRERYSNHFAKKMFDLKNDCFSFIQHHGDWGGLSYVGGHILFQIWDSSPLCALTSALLVIEREHFPICFFS